MVFSAPNESNRVPKEKTTTRQQPAVLWWTHRGRGFGSVAEDVAVVADVGAGALPRRPAHGSPPAHRTHHRLHACSKSTPQENSIKPARRARNRVNLAFQRRAKLKPNKTQ